MRVNVIVPVQNIMHHDDRTHLTCVLLKVKGLRTKLFGTQEEIHKVKDYIQTLESSKHSIICFL